MEFPALPRQGDDIMVYLEWQGDTRAITATVCAVLWIVDDFEGGLEAVPCINAEVFDGETLRLMGIEPAYVPPGEPRPIRRPRARKSRRR